MRIINNQIIKKARKIHCCDGRQQLERNVDPNDERHETVTDQIQNCKNIKKGDSYFKQTQIIDGELVEWKCCLKCNNQIEKFNFYEND